MSGILQTERLWLRASERRDCAVLANLFADFEVSRQTARISHPYRLADAERFVAFCMAKRRSDSGAAFLIVCKERGAIELGYATEAARAAAAFAFANFGNELLLAGHAIDNPASGRVLAKLGFVVTGQDDMVSIARGGSIPCNHLALKRDAFAARML